MNAITLSSQHRRILERGSAILPEVIEARGYFTAQDKSELNSLGFPDSQSRVPALAIPIFGTDGIKTTYQLRPDRPRIRAGKPIKYETPFGSKMVLDVHPYVTHILGNPNIPLWITEGIKKGDALVSHGLCAVALLGVWNWRGSSASWQ